MKHLNCGVTDVFWDIRLKQERNYNERIAWKILKRQYKDTVVNASGGTQFFWNLVLNKFLGAVAGTWPSPIFVGLSSTLPTDASTSNWNVTEPSTGSYSRQSITPAGSAWSANPITGGSGSNAAAVTWTTATATLLSGVNLTDWLIWDASTAGNLHLWADLTTPQPVFSGNPYSMAIGALVVAGI
jgi:hypothetical protein